MEDCIEHAVVIRTLTRDFGIRHEVTLQGPDGISTSLWTDEVACGALLPQHVHEGVVSAAVEAVAAALGFHVEWPEQAAQESDTTLKSLTRRARANNGRRRQPHRED